MNDVCPGRIQWILAAYHRPLKVAFGSNRHLTIGSDIENRLTSPHGAVSGADPATSADHSVIAVFDGGITAAGPADD